MLRSPKPEWLKVRPPAGERYALIKARAKDLALATVCEEARCPNVAECWGGGTATFMLMGDTCTRGCRFCHVKTGRPQALDPDEPQKVASVIAELGLDYVVLTSVDRDDLPDGGAGHFAATVRQLKRRLPDLLVEVLIPDFQGDRSALATVAASGADVVAHNIETVARLTPTVRDRRATYAQSLGVLQLLKALDRERPSGGAGLDAEGEVLGLGAEGEVLAEGQDRGSTQRLYTKSSIMVGLGETEAEVEQCLRDLRAVECDIVTFGQYLQPSARYLPVVEYIHPDQFARYRQMAEDLGFLYVASGPLVRSSYRAAELFLAGEIRQQGLQAPEVAQLPRPLRDLPLAPMQPLSIPS